MEQIKDQLLRLLKSKVAITAIITPLLIALVFGYMLSNNQILKGPLAVIDLDNTPYSKDLINKLDASPYVQVKETFHEAIEPKGLFVNERFIAVVVLPENLEINRYRGVQSKIGLVIDDTLLAGAANIRQGIVEVLSTENATVSMVKLMGMGLSNQQATGLISGLAIEQRTPYNPSSDYINTVVVGFIHMILFALIMLQTAKIVPELREEKLLNQALRSPVGVLSRVLPYVFLFSVSTIFTLGLLKKLANLRFVGNVYEFILVLFLYYLIAGLLGMLLGWTAKDSNKTTSRVMVMVAPSFLLSNFTLPLALMPSPLQYLALIFPMNWYMRFFKEIAMRGTSVSFLGKEIGGFIFMLIIISLFLLLFIFKDARNEKEEKEDFNKGLPQVL